MKKPPARMSTLRFIFIAAILMLLADTYLFGGTRGYIEEAKQEAHKQVQMVRPPVRIEPEEGAFFESGELQQPHALGEEAAPTNMGEGKPQSQPAEQAGITGSPQCEFAAGECRGDDEAVDMPPVAAPRHQEKRRIAIIIDDLGMDAKRSRAVLDLPSPITLAFLPYGTKTRDYAKIGQEKGHELIIHMPMEAMDPRQNIGPGGLKAGMNQDVFEQNFNEMLKSFDGYVGINNHMGSRLTQDGDAMSRLMPLIKARDLFFVDSKTINHSVAARSARGAGVPYAVRDVFLDHEESRAFVDRALRHTEEVANRKGYAIAIGHPKDNTIAGLREWIPTLASKGIELVPVSDLLTRVTQTEHPREGGDPLVVPQNSMDHGSQVSVTPDGVTSPNVRDDNIVGIGDDELEERGEKLEAEEVGPTPAAPERHVPLLLHLPPPTELPAIY